MQVLIPLPCTKTVRDYISLIDSKCPFDEKCFILLKKAFQTKKPENRHSMITLDGINLRKSMAVNSRTLTYIRLTDGGEGLQISNVDDLATHGRVLQYQSLTEKYTQPIAVFVSKHSVHGDELAKITLKANKVLEESLLWLTEWEKEVISGNIPADEFLTKLTLRLRL